VPWPTFHDMINCCSCPGYVLKVGGVEKIYSYMVSNNVYAVQVWVSHVAGTPPTLLAVRTMATPLTSTAYSGDKRTHVGSSFPPAARIKWALLLNYAKGACRRGIVGTAEGVAPIPSGQVNFIDCRGMICYSSF